MCQFYVSPTAEERAAFKISDPQIVLGCDRPQGEGPLYFFVPVEGGAARVAVCTAHAAYLEQLYGSRPAGETP